MAVELTVRQQEVLGYIERRLNFEGIPPSIQEIQKEFGFKSPNAVQTHLLALIKKGFVQRPRRQARSLRLVKQENEGETDGMSALGGVRAYGASVSALHPARDLHAYRNGKSSVAATPFSNIPTILVPAATPLEMGIDVFFNARHVVAAEFGGDVHAHSWRLRAVVLVRNRDGDVGISVGEIQPVIQEVVDEIEGTVLNDLEAFRNIEPTLERTAGWLNGRVKDRLSLLGVRLGSITLWDQPTQYVSIAD